MSILTILQKGIATADKITKSVQDTVAHKAWVGQTGDGTPQYTSPIVRQAVVERMEGTAYTPSGELVRTKASITFVGPVPPTTALPGQKRVNPIDDRDVFTLSDGTTGPTIMVSGPMDPSTSAPMILQVMLGK